MWVLLQIVVMAAVVLQKGVYLFYDQVDWYVDRFRGYFSVNLLVIGNNSEIQYKHALVNYREDKMEYRIAQLCGRGKYWRIGLSPRIGGEIFGEFGFTSQDTKWQVSIGG